jgi:N-acetylglutamate synthase
VIRISAADVGARVSVRARIPAAPGEPSMTDTLGYLRAWADGLLTVERRDGSMVQIRTADLVAGRTIPPPPQRRPRG